MENLDIFEKCFEKCRIINSDIEQGNEEQAREKLIQLLDDLNKNNISYEPIVNHLIRQTGLYPYIQTETAHWEDRFVKEVFKVDTGAREPQTLHREQSALLKKLLNGTDIVVSAPTSFGKSFIIDAFITIKNPTNVVIIVPTIALTDETRRRLHRKFADKYKIITHSDIELGEKNIFIFPQERAISYINKIPDIDIFIVDEFYKADSSSDERVSILQKVILEFSPKSKQRYFLAPNIDEFKDIGNNPLTKDMEPITLNFNTVCLEINKCYKNNGVSKEQKLLNILSKNKGQTIIYAHIHREINNVAKILMRIIDDKNDNELNIFSNWLKINYSQNYILSNLIKKGIGIHNGHLHRCLSQLQIHLFAKRKINNIISTSSLIEGVNTSAENIIIWRTKYRSPYNGYEYNVNSFNYKNIIGRSGRMFQYFIGKIYLLEEPPEEQETKLSPVLTDDVLHSLNENELTRIFPNNQEQIEKIIQLKEQLKKQLDSDIYNQIIKDNLFKKYNKSSLINILNDIINNKEEWKSLDFECLNSDNIDSWELCLNKTLECCGIKRDEDRKKNIFFIKTISQNWSANSSIPDLLDKLREYRIEIDEFFKLEMNITFKISTTLEQINILYGYIFPEKNIDISEFIFRTSNAFLPRLVYELEEYGLPRMVSKKIHNAGIINLEDEKSDINQIIEEFNKIGCDEVKKKIMDLHPFEEVILDYFFDGIETDRQKEIRELLGI